MKLFSIKINYILFFTLLLTFFSYGQVDKEILNDINSANGLIETNASEALQFAHSAFTKSRENNFDKGVAESYIIVGRCYIQKGDIGAQKALNAALKFAEKIQDQGLISDCYFYLGKSCFINGDTKSQLNWYNKAFEIRKTLNDQKRLADSYHGYGNVYLAMNQDSLAESYFNLSKNIRSMMNDMSGLAALCNNLAIIAGNRGDTAQYMNLMYQAVQMNEETGNKRYLAVNHGNLGMVYREQAKYDSALRHATLAFEIRKENNFKDHLCGSYTDLGKIMFAQKKYKEALDYFKQGAELAQSIQGTEWMIGNYASLAETYTALDSQPQAKKYKDLEEKLKKEHEADTLLSKTIPLPSGFDLEEPQPETNWLWWIIGAVVLLCLGGFALYNMKK